MRRVLTAVLLCLGAVSCGADEDAAATEPSDPPGTEAGPTCEEIERFADSLVDVGITYDYQGSWSPSEAAADADAVIAGRLTGGVTERPMPPHRRDEPSEAGTYVAYEVEIVEDLAPTARWVAGATIDVLVEHNPAHRPDIDGLRDAAARGAPVVVIAYEHPESGELVASIEGFITSCEDGPLLGWTGHLGTWSQLATVDDVTDALQAAEEAEPCGVDAGSPTDLSAEPPGWEQFGAYQRWQDLAGCDVRIDVISHTRGHEHCGWEAAEFVTIGDPIGASIDVAGLGDRVRTYVWDPEGVFADVDEVDRATALPVDDLPASAVDTAYRQGTAQLWLDAAAPDHLYRVDGGWAQRFVLDAERRLLCA